MSLALTVLLAATPAIAADSAWNGGDGNWSAATNWTPDTAAPGAGDTATITGSSADQTVTYDSAASGLLGTLILDQAASGFANTLLVSKSLTIASDIALGGNDALGTAQLQLGAGTTLKIGDATTRGALTIGQNAVLLATDSSSSPTIDANVTLNAGGLITLNSAAAVDTRTTLLGNFTANGGTIERVAGNAGQGILQLKGATNVLNNVTLSDTLASTKGLPYIYLNGNATSGAADQSFSTNITVPILALRGATGTKTLATTGSGVITQIRLGNYAANSELTLKLGGDLALTNGIADGVWGASTGTTLNLDTAGHTLTNTSTLNFISANLTGATWNIKNTAATAGKIVAANYTFNAANTNTVTGDLTLQATGTGANAFANATFGASTRFHYTGTAGSFSSTNALASIEVGNGVNASALTRTGSALTLTGNLKINTAATYTAGGYATTLTGSITGSGTYHAINSSGNVTWSSGSIGGLSAGDAAGQTGTLTFSAAGTVSGIPTINLAATSVSVFDIASASSYDVVNLGAFNIAFNGTLYLNFLDGYTPEDGASFDLFRSASELNSASVAFTGTKSGDFITIASNLAGFEFSFDAGTGIVSVTSAIPEPATVAILAGLAMLAGAAIRKRRRLARAFPATNSQ
ncbi:anchor protein [Opitutaceae bacterium TAV5]|nr:anchor protein [Opitutaceae bacterium TAV5]